MFIFLTLILWVIVMDLKDLVNGRREPVKTTTVEKGG